MASMSDHTEDNLPQLVFENTDWANIGDAGGLRGSVTPGSFWIMLLTADPTDAGTQTNECTYTSYARVAVARSTAGWGTTSGVTTNDADIAFPAATGGSETATHAAVVDTVTSGEILFHGALSSSIVITSGVQPKILAGQLSITWA